MSPTELFERLRRSETTPWILKAIKNGPRENGCHPYLYSLARGIYEDRYLNHFTYEEIFTVLRAKADNYHRSSGPVPDREIEEAIKDAIRDSDAEVKTGQPAVIRTNWPQVEYAKVDRIVRTSGGLKALRAASQVDLLIAPATTDDIVSQMFGYEEGVNDPLICGASGEKRWNTWRLSKWLKVGDLNQCSHIVANAMSKVMGLTQGGKPSSRCRDNTGPREYLIVECDIAKLRKDGKKPTEWKPWIESWEKEGRTIADACAAVFLHLSKNAPLVLAVHSGNKSIHGWFSCRGIDEERLKGFFKYAVSIGADDKLWWPEQLTRMPGGRRVENRKLQEVLFYDPEKIKNRREALR